MSSDDTGDDTSPPLVVEFEVAVAPDHAFELWTARTALWWPPSHTVSGQPERIVFEPQVGGRIYEQAPDGSEHPWGEVVAHDRPQRIAFWWHLFFDRTEATLVDITFEPTAGGTRVRLVQSGWDALGEQGPPRRDRTATAWAHITGLFAAAADQPPTIGSGRTEPT